MRLSITAEYLHLHYKGFADDAANRRFKLFIFSTRFFILAKITENGFIQVWQIRFVFFTPMKKSSENRILGLFYKQGMLLKLTGKDIQSKLEKRLSTMKKRIRSGPLS